jgi:hypothetical protein
MQSVANYALSDGSSGEYQLGWKESKTVATGFGTVTIDAGPAGSLTVECLGPAELTISGVCVPDAGVVFTVRNNGGPMSEPQAYTLNNTTTNTFLLGSGGQIAIEAGFGDPVFFSEGLTTNFGGTCKPAGSIIGMVWSDVDGDGLRDSDEPGLGDIEVSLSADGVLFSYKTAPDGMYFFDVVPGSYSLSVAPQDEIAPYLKITADPDGKLDGITTINIDASHSDFTGNFGLQATQTGSISGIVWLETHDFGTHNDDEAGMAATTVQLLDADGNVQRIFVIEADGHYEFTDLQPGLYTVQIATDNLPPQTFATVDPDGELDFESEILMHPGEDLQDVDFGIVGTF